MTVQEMKEAACRAIDAHAQEIIDLSEDIFREPELGFKEFKTAAKIQKKLDEIGFAHKDGVAVTGIVTPVKGRSSKARLAIMGELDALIVSQHPSADPQTGAAHVCGHNCQAASVVGVAYALKESGIMDELDGDIVLMHVPAEEYIEMPYRRDLIEQGVIRTMGGKQEFIRLGEFDDIDMMLMQHGLSTEGPEPSPIKANGGCAPGNAMGFLARMVKFIGKEAGGSNPEFGVNALYAANLAILAINAQRDTFLEKDKIRIHPIITKGGELVNVVPADVRIETYIRGSNTAAILDAAERFDRSCRAGAMAMGCQVEITKLPGYMCPNDCPPYKDLAVENLKYIFGEDKVRREDWGASTDAYDVAQLMPMVHMNIGGYSGVFHSPSYAVPRPDMAVVDAAKVMVCTAIDLLADGAEKALQIKKDFKAPLTKEEYLTKWCALEKGKDF